MSDAPTSRYELDRGAWGEALNGLPRYRLDQVWDGLYHTLAALEEVTALPAALRADLAARFPSALTLRARQVGDGGATVKSLWSLHDGNLIESVLMYSAERVTVCISTQAGCAMACGFCATGQAGFHRHLHVGEIVEQVVRAAAEAAAADRRLSNVVLMGMGEPLANEPVTWAALERMHDALGISARHLTVSTVGIIPGIRRLAERPLPVNLAVSLHAANDELRDRLVPINRRYPIADLLDACDDYLHAKGRRLSFEWAMIDGVNDRPSDAAELAHCCASLTLPAHVNLIPLNATPGWPTTGTPLRRVHQFRDELERRGVNATVRHNRGTDIDAACGQLAAGQPVSVGLGRRPQP